MSDIQIPKSSRKVKPTTSTPRGKYEEAVEEFKAILVDKTHPKNRTKSYNINLASVLNRLLVAADELEADSGEGIYGLIILALNTNLSIKDKIIELQVENKELERRIRKLEKRE